MGWLGRLFGVERREAGRSEGDASALERLAPWRERHRRVAWRPSTEDRDGAADASKFGGAAWLRPGEAWPACPRCSRPMPLFLQLDLAAAAASTGLALGDGLLQLFYCVEDCDHEGWEPFGGGKLVRVLPAGAPGGAGTPPMNPGGQPFPPRSITGWEPADDYPDLEEIDGLGLEMDWDFKANRVTVRWPEGGVAVEADQDFPERLSPTLTGDKLGGWPSWVQGVEYPSCPRCGKRMELVIQVDSEDHVNFMFGDVGCGHITRCPDHPDVLAFGWACH